MRSALTGSPSGDHPAEQREDRARGLRDEHVLRRFPDDIAVDKAGHALGGAVDGLVDEALALHADDHQRVGAVLEIGAEPLLALTELLRAGGDLGFQPGRALAQGADRFVPVGDVHRRADDADRPAILELAAAGRAQPARRAAGQQDAELVLEGGRLHPGSGDRLGYTLAVLGMDQPHPGHCVRRFAGRVEAPERALLLRPSASAGLHVGLPHADLAHLLGEQQAALALFRAPQRRVSLRVARDQFLAGVVKRVGRRFRFQEAACRGRVRDELVPEPVGLASERVERAGNVAGDQPGEAEAEQQHRAAAAGERRGAAEQRPAHQRLWGADADQPPGPFGSGEAEQDRAPFRGRHGAETLVPAGHKLRDAGRERLAGAAARRHRVRDDPAGPIGDQGIPVLRERLRPDGGGDFPDSEDDDRIEEHGAVTDHRHMHGDLLLVGQLAGEQIGDERAAGFEHSPDGALVRQPRQRLPWGAQRIGDDLGVRPDQHHDASEPGGEQGAGGGVFELGRIALWRRKLGEGEADGLGAADLGVEGERDPAGGAHRPVLEQPGADGVGVFEQRAGEEQHGKRGHEDQQQQAEPDRRPYGAHAARVTLPDS